MKHHIGMRAFSMLLAFLLVSVTFMPLVSAESQKSSWQRVVLEKSGFTVNNLEQTITSTEKLTDKVVYSGTYKIDVQKNVDGKMKRLNTEGIFTTTLNADGTIRMEGYPDTSSTGLKGNDADLSFVTDIKKVGEADGKNIYRVNQQVSFNGKTQQSETTIETPIRSDSGINADGTDAAKGML